MAEAARDDTAGLRALASQTAGARGHELAEWTPESAESAVADTAFCRWCGLPVHIRIEGGLKGLAGPALTSPCSARSQPA
jgi:hypothetical protein